MTVFSVVTQIYKLGYFTFDVFERIVTL